MSPFTGRHVRLEVEGSTREAVAVMVSDNHKSLVLDLQGEGIRYRDGAVLFNFMPLLADKDGGDGDYTCLITGAAAKVTWL